MISLIVGMDRNGLIGLDQKIPWHRPADLKNFAALTRGNTVVMGRKTFESIGKPLPDRENIVLSKKFEYPNTYNYSSIGDLLVLYRGCIDELFVIGGSEIYKTFAPYIDRLYITVVNHTTPLNGRESTFFPWPAFANTSWICREQKMLGLDYYYVYDKVNNNGNQKTTNCLTKANPAIQSTC